MYHYQILAWGLAKSLGRKRKYLVWLWVLPWLQLKCRKSVKMSLDDGMEGEWKARALMRCAMKGEWALMRCAEALRRGEGWRSGVGGALLLLSCGCARKSQSKSVSQMPRNATSPLSHVTLAK